MYKYLALCFIFFPFLIQRRLSFLKTFLVAFNVQQKKIIWKNVLWRSKSMLEERYAYKMSRGFCPVIVYERLVLCFFQVEKRLTDEYECTHA